MENRQEIEQELFETLQKESAKQCVAKTQEIWASIWKELRSNKVAMLSLCLLIVLMIAVLLAPLSPYDPYALDSTQR